MSFALSLALRYLQSRKRGTVSIGALLATIGVGLGVATLIVVISVTGGFREEFRQKVLGVNAHVLVLRVAGDFTEYREKMAEMEAVPEVIGVAPFVIHPMMLTRGDRTATGVMVKGVDPERMGRVLDLPSQIVEGDLAGFRLPGAKAPDSRAPYRTGDRRPSGSLHGSSGSPSGGAFPGNGPRPAPVGSAAAAARTTASAGPAPSLHPAGPTSPKSGWGSSFGESTADDPALDALLGTGGPSGAAAPAPAPAPLPDAAVAAGVRPSDGESRARPDSAAKAPAAAPSATPAVPSLQAGSTVPTTGWGSSFVDDVGMIELPDDVDPDPCDDPQAVAALPGIVIGVTLSEQLAAPLGACVQVTSPTIGYAVRGGTIHAPVAQRFRVIAIFKAGFDQYDAKFAYTDLFEAMRFQSAGDAVTGIEMKVRDIDRARHVKEHIEQMLAGGPYFTMDWMELNRGLFTALWLQQILMSGVLAIIIIVATFTVVATLIMVVLEKKKEIAILKAMGATDGTLLRSFLLQGVIIGTVGTSTGLLVGWLVCAVILAYGFPLDPGVYFISRLPVQLEWEYFAIVGGFSMSVCTLATLWPAFYAARLRPAQALREQ